MLSLESMAWMKGDVRARDTWNLLHVLSHKGKVEHEGESVWVGVCIFCEELCQFQRSFSVQFITVWVLQ